ncbi:hypothetical protein BFP76_13760 [Amylibacter kogurei]|uniref:Peptidase M20 dimerisation domain-containing protein n=2 Tax=Paramylibacter kogurei TaxID=1889778 RepID=A0A2G5K9I7_9RHOB|nr:amidohydrolase [Amylibacter kogurei]PIB26191.1 hypothetical protein BFP76_13760 [Amylibacter kogurei]
MGLSKDDLAKLVALRHELHQHPEVSGQEEQTAARLVAFLDRNGLRPDAMHHDLGGHGLALEYIGADDGPTVMIRCELDALPIVEQNAIPHRSSHEGVAHLCGHDGHMATVIALAFLLRDQPLKRGRVILLFQGAEETGAGAQALLDDARFEPLYPDYIFALHNLPKLPLGEVQLGTGVVCCASRGMKITLIGKTSHAAAPQDGVSPVGAMATLMKDIPTFCTGARRDENFVLTTITHANVGVPNFGVAPADATLWVTLRTVTQSRMDALVDDMERLVATEAFTNGLAFDVQYQDVFDATENHGDAVAHISKAARINGITPHDLPEPMSWSEDFGRFAKTGAKAGMFFLGSGIDQPQLHNPDFDFPDELIPIGAKLFWDIISDVMG